jgi:peroxiredoxin
MNTLSLMVLTAFATTGATAGQLADSPVAVKPLGVGATIPAVTVKTSAGVDFPLKEKAAGKPTVLLFYRGGWCPYCNRHLADVQTVEKELVALGYQILAISAGSPEALAATAEKNKLSYTLLSDPDMQAAGAFGLAFALDDETVTKYKGYGIHLTAQQAGHFWLPVPAAYVVDAKGNIVFAHSNPDYKQRLSGADLLKAAQQAAGK